MGTLPEDDRNGSQDLTMRTDEGSGGEIIVEEGGEDTLLVARATGWLTQEDLPDDTMLFDS